MDKRETIIGIIKKLSGKDAPSPDEALFDSGYLDSFALPDLVGELEQQFGLKIPDSDLNPRKFESVDRIESYLASRGA
jgi:acyl carrier protein